MGVASKATEIALFKGCNFMIFLHFIVFMNEGKRKQRVSRATRPVENKLRCLREDFLHRFCAAKLAYSSVLPTAIG
jgi:hypothetical protein